MTTYAEIIKEIVDLTRLVREADTSNDHEAVGHAQYEIAHGLAEEIAKREATIDRMARLQRYCAPDMGVHDVSLGEHDLPGGQIYTENCPTCHPQVPPNAMGMVHHA